jgi:tetratricopeptide (TPR) repeat protein
MRPDSQLYIVPFAGGKARRLRANTPTMNSWHSFSPNGRWLVFSSKARSPYTQMYLTHIDPDGNSSPAILVDNTTAANRAVNLPEFVNIPAGGMEQINVPAVEQYRLMDQAMQLEEKGENDKALALWKNAVALDPTSAKAQNGLGISLYVHGEKDEAFTHLREAVHINPLAVDNHYVLGKFLLEQGHPNEALAEFQTAETIRQHYLPGEVGLATAFEVLGNDQEALTHWRKAHAIDPANLSATLGTAWLLATAPDGAVRNGREALTLAQSADSAEATDDPAVLDTLAAAWAENGDFSRAASTASHALALATRNGNAQLSTAIRAHLATYQQNRPFRDVPKPDGSPRAMAVSPVMAVERR